MGQTADTDAILFFGCGTHKEAEMMTYIIGRELLLHDAVPAILHDYSLGVQSLDKTPDVNIANDNGYVSVRSILKKNWGQAFQNYIAKPDAGKYVRGNVWQITSDELDIIRYWEFVEYGWYDELGVTVLTDEGITMSVITVCLRQGQNIDKLAHPEVYDPWLQTPERYKVATSKSRLLFLAEREQPTLIKITQV